MSLVSRVLSGAAAAGAACAAAGVTVVALSFALYAFAKDYVGAPGASAIVAAVVALLLAIGLAVAASGAKGPKSKPRPHKPGGPAHEPQSLLDRVLDTARERPVIAAAGAVAAGLLALRNPALVTALVGLMSQPKPPPRR